MSIQKSHNKPYLPLTNEGEHRLLSLRKLNLTPFGKPKILFEEDFIFVRRKLEFSPKENSFSFGHKFRAAYKEEHERNFLRSVFRQYKEGYPLGRLFPSRIYRSLQERDVIHHSRAEKNYALSLFNILLICNIAIFAGKGGWADTKSRIRN